MLVVFYMCNLFLVVKFGVALDRMPTFIDVSFEKVRFGTTHIEVRLVGALKSSDMTSPKAKEPGFEGSLEEAELAKIRMESSRAACVPFERKSRGCVCNKNFENRCVLQYKKEHSLRDIKDTYIVMPPNKLVFLSYQLDSFS